MENRTTGPVECWHHGEFVEDALNPDGAPDATKALSQRPARGEPVRVILHEEFIEDGTAELPAPPTPPSAAPGVLPPGPPPLPTETP